jgi:hypothetical protein
LPVLMTTPSASNFLRNSSVFATLAIVAFNFATMSDGVPAGA